MRPEQGWKGWALAAGDLVALFLGLWLALAVRHFSLPSVEVLVQHLPGFGYLFAMFLLVFTGLGLYELRRLRDLPWILGGVGTALAINALAGTIYWYTFYPWIGYTPKTHFALALVFGHGAVLGWRRVAFHLFRARLTRQRVHILGSSRLARELVEELLHRPELGYEPVAAEGPRVDLLVADPRWVEAHWSAAREVVGEAVRRRRWVAGLSEFYETVFGKVDPGQAANAGWLIGAFLSRTTRAQMALKRAADGLVAFALLVFAAPVLALVWLAVRALDGAPVFYGQRRIGFMGREFTMWKFRTMRPRADRRGPFTGGAEEAGLVTPLGRCLRRCRLDELPQLWNVLRGEMSLVGPRPEWSREVAVIERLIPHYHIRHLVRPGITGWAQLNWRATKNPRDSLEKFRFDLYYLKHMSPALDLAILMRTARRVLMRDSAMAAARRPDFRLTRAGTAFAADFTGLLGRRPAR